MKRDPSFPSKPEKSFSVAIEQMAQLLRSQVKLKDRVTPGSALSPSFKNSLEQIAKLMRSAIRAAKKRPKIKN